MVDRQTKLRQNDFHIARAVRFADFIARFSTDIVYFFYRSSNLSLPIDFYPIIKFLVWKDIFCSFRLGVSLVLFIHWIPFAFAAVHSKGHPDVIYLYFGQFCNNAKSEISVFSDSLKYGNMQKD